MKYLKKHIVLISLLPLFWIIVNYLSSKPEAIEKYYSGIIYPFISKTFRFLNGWIPFSFGDFLGILLLLSLGIEIYKLIKNKFITILHFTLKITSVLSILYFCFYFFWGLNYFRKPLAQKLKLKHSKYTTYQLINTTRIIIQKLNEVHLKITKNDTIMVKNPYRNKELFMMAKNGFDNISKQYPFLSYQNVSVKNSLISLFQSYNGTSGYINPITGEAQINAMIPKTGMPATICHEIAHQIGWNAENEANFIGFLTSTHNVNLYFKYSGYRMAFRYAIIELKKRDKKAYTKLWKEVNSGIAKDFSNTYDHWKKFKNPIEPYLKKGYNSYLKANNQKNGINSYNYVVNLLICYFEKNNLENKHNL